MVTMADPNHAHDPGKIVPRGYLVPFCLVTSLFALWGFANDVTNPMVKSFEDVFRLTATQSSQVQQAFYYGYAIMAIPAAVIIRKTSFKTGIVLGLLLYVCGAFLFWPASEMQVFSMFLLSFLIVTCGLSFLETAANPYILSMGPLHSATQRLNLAQAFNPMGSLCGMFVAGQLVLPFLWTNEFRDEIMISHPEYKTMLPADAEKQIQREIDEYIQENPEAYQEHLEHDLNIIRMPYLTIGMVVAAVLVTFLVSKMPDTGQSDESVHLGQALGHLLTFRYLGGVAAQAFYVGAQIACWTYIIHYGITQLNWTAAQSQNANICAMVTFLTFRWVWTYVLRFVSPGLLLGCLAVGGLLTCTGAAVLPGMVGLVSLIATSACMSAMFPTIYGIALRKMSVEDAKLASAGLIISIAGGGFVPWIQSSVIDMQSIDVAGITDSVRASFLVPAACFLFVIFYGFVIHFGDRSETPHAAV
jgi:MFS transporter, FHS family, L-fucose permease